MRQPFMHFWPFTIMLLACALAGGMTSAQEEEPWLPTRAQPPVFPPGAFQQRITEGLVIVRYTVTERGRVRDAEVVDSSSHLFESSALQTVRGLRYEPKLEDGEPVAVQGITMRISYTPDGPAMIPVAD